MVALSRLRRSYAPLAFLVGAFAMLFDGLKLLVLNWRLGLVEALPAMWAWLAMLDLRVHLFGGRQLRSLHGATLIAGISAVTLVTMTAFFLNGVFAFALTSSGQPMIRPALSRARSAGATLLGWGLIEGVGLGVATLMAGRWGRGWFLLSTSVMVGLLMFSYVAVPSRILGVGDLGPRYGRRDRVIATAIGGILGAIVCTPPYLLGRLGIVMLGVRSLIVPAVVMLIVGFGLQAGASGSVRAIKMSSKLTTAAMPTGSTNHRRDPGAGPPAGGGSPSGGGAAPEPPTNRTQPCSGSTSWTGPNPAPGSTVGQPSSRSTDGAPRPS